MTSYGDSPALLAGRSIDGVVNGIGPRLRDLRLQHGLSLQQLAERAGVSAAAIHKIERNGMVPTITTLLKLADAFERPVAYFVDEESDAAGPVAFIPAADRPVVFSSRPGVEVQAISGAYAQFFLAGSVVTVDPGAGGGPSGRAQGQHEELVMVLEGSLRFEVDGHEYVLGPGDALHLRTDRPHRWDNPARKRAQAVWLTLRPLQSCAAGT